MTASGADRCTLQRDRRRNAPIELYEVDGSYHVVDGHYRVSVARHWATTRSRRRFAAGCRRRWPRTQHERRRYRGPLRRAPVSIGTEPASAERVLRAAIEW